MLGADFQPELLTVSVPAPPERPDLTKTYKVIAQ